MRSPAAAAGVGRSRSRALTLKVLGLAQQTAGTSSTVVSVVVHYFLPFFFVSASSSVTYGVAQVHRPEATSLVRKFFQRGGAPRVAGFPPPVSRIEGVYVSTSHSLVRARVVVSCQRRFRRQRRTPSTRPAVATRDRPAHSSQLTAHATVRYASVQFRAGRPRGVLSAFGRRYAQRRSSERSSPRFRPAQSRASAASAGLLRRVSVTGSSTFLLLYPQIRSQRRLNRPPS